MKSIAFLAATLLCTADALQPSRIVHPRQTKAKPTTEPSKPAQLNIQVSQGCYSSKGDLVFNGTTILQSKGFCVNFCVQTLEKPVAAMSGGNQCWCGDSYPPIESIVDDDNCNVGCISYPLEACGGVKFWSVFNTGITLDVDHSKPDEAKASGTGTGNLPKPTQTTIEPPKETVIINNEAPPEKEKKTNTAGIAAGVVVAVVAVVAVAVGAWMYIRKKKNREIEEEHRRNAAVSSFMGKAPSSSGTSITDARLDPVMAQRRMSDGSIADNQDYSRRILRVTNA
ncbi:hypothetical protein QBC37DRAFT_396623 [Rhypophila decipiens]|uniref:WSC domain-containing protein n=1 Tax=Rhypophila decipiens TaxID=261697 RepID=A0AAN7BBB2_9PEZI|nr:hypothetical protein QBC37DRAFT_396623 [Rhypophila decipiens]